jgi:hypothetical protein
VVPSVGKRAYDPRQETAWLFRCFDTAVAVHLVDHRACRGEVHRSIVLEGDRLDLLGRDRADHSCQLFPAQKIRIKRYA